MLEDGPTHAPTGCAAPPALPGSYLVVELTNRCSLACVHCSVSEEGHGHHRNTGYLDPLIFDALIDDLIDTGARFGALILFWLGEPLLHPHFTRIYRRAVRAADEHGTFGQVEVHSNATHLNADRVRALLNEARVPQVLHLSLDAAGQAVYHAVKGLDRFERVQTHVTHLLQEKGRTGAQWPRVVLQYIVGSNNVDEVGVFRSHWEGVARAAGLRVRSVAGHVPSGGDVVVFYRQLDAPTPELQQAENAIFRRAMAEQGLELPAQAAHGRTVRAENLASCSGFWKSPVVDWRGSVTVCTRDNLLENGIGSLQEHRFSELWWGAEMRRRRRSVAKGDYAGLSLCTTCFIPRSLNHTELSTEDIERQEAHDRSVERVY